jgi:hypothetical protein
MSARKAFPQILNADSSVNSELGGRIYVGFAPSETARPFIVFRTQMEDDTYTKDNSSTVDVHRGEIDIYHDTIADAESVGALCYTALSGYRGTTSGGVVVTGCKLESEDPDFDVEQVPIWTQDYLIRINR